jgi:hypothetical protein
LDRSRPEQGGVSPVGVIVLGAITGISDDQLQLAHPRQRHADLPGWRVAAHHAAVKNLPTVGGDFEDDARNRGVSLGRIDAHPRLEALVAPAQIVDQLAAGMSAKAAGKAAVPDLQRRAADTAIERQRTGGLPLCHGLQFSQRNAARIFRRRVSGGGG